MTESDTPLPRDQFPVTEHWCFLDHAGVAPLPRTAADAAAAATRAFVDHGSQAVDEWDARAEEVRAASAGLLGVPVETVAFVKNTTEGLAFVASGIDWQPGDRVLVPAHEFPSTLYPWLALRDRGVQVELVEPVGDGGTLPLEVFASALDQGPARAVACSWVQFGAGWRTDLAALATLCHERGALLCADVIQGLGVVPADLGAWGVDFATADAHKWMLGPSGCGVLYVAPGREQLLRVLEPGWNSVAHRHEWDNPELVLDPTARRFEGGTLNLTGIAAMGASIDLLTETGIDAVWAHVEELCRVAAVGLADIGATILSDRSLDGRSAILTFTVPGVDPDELCAGLRERKVVSAPRGGGVRVAPHGYNTLDEMEQLVAAVRELAPTRPAPAAPAPPPRQGPMRRPKDW